MLSPASLLKVPYLVVQPVLLLGAFNPRAIHLGPRPIDGARQPCVAWCGASAVPDEGQDLKDWGTSPHGDERYCPRCAERAKQMHVALGAVQDMRHPLFVRSKVPLNNLSKRITSVVVGLVIPSNKVH